MSAASCQSRNYIIKHSKDEAIRYSHSEKALNLKGLGILLFDTPVFC